VNGARLLVIALAGAISILAQTASIAAAPAKPPHRSGVSVKGINVGAYPDVRVSVVTSTPSSSAPALTENGRRVPLMSAQNLGQAKSVVLAIDRSRSMQGRALADALAAARVFVGAKAPADRIAIVGFGLRAIQLTRFSSTMSDAVGALRTMAVDSQEGTALYDAVVRASQALATESLPGRVIILLTDGRDVSSHASLEEAVKEARASGSSVYSLAIERPGDQVAVRAYSNGSASPDALFNLPTNLGPGAGDPKPSRLLPSILYKTVLGTQVMALISFFVVLIGASLALTTVKGSRLRRRIAPHLATSVEVRKRKQEKERFAAAAGLFKATEAALAHWKFWIRLERLLERSDLPLRTVELVYLIAGAGLLGATLATLSGQSGIVTLAMLAGCGLIPVGVVWFKATRRLRAFENQLPDVLITLAAALKAGHSFKQGLQTIVDEGNPPANKEFQRVLAEARLGRPLDLALGDMSVRLGSKNFDFVITAVTIQQQVGGSLAGLIDMVADTVRQRQQFIRKIKGLTAMGRAGAYVLVGLPFLVAIGITLINPGYMDPLYHSSTGHMLIYTGLTMMAFGSVILKKIVSFKG
jgi:tight adherence protein B